MYRKIYSIVPRPCVELVIKDKKGVILVKREIEPYKGMWHLPGCKLLYRETFKECAKRVAKSETNLKIKIKKFLCANEYPFNEKNNSEHAISLVYLAEPLTFRLKENKYGKDVYFFKKIPSNTIKGHKELLKNYFKMK